MAKLKLSETATARKFLAVLDESYKPLTKREAVQARLSLKDLDQRYAAAWMRLALKAILDQ